MFSASMVRESYLRNDATSLEMLFQFYLIVSYANIQASPRKFISIRD